MYGLHLRAGGWWIVLHRSALASQGRQRPLRRHLRCRRLSGEVQVGEVSGAADGVQEVLECLHACIASDRSMRPTHCTSSVVVESAAARVPAWRRYSTHACVTVWAGATGSLPISVYGHVLSGETAGADKPPVASEIECRRKCHESGTHPVRTATPAAGLTPPEPNTRAARTFPRSPPGGGVSTSHGFISRSIGVCSPISPSPSKPATSSGAPALSAESMHGEHQPACYSLWSPCRP